MSQPYLAPAELTAEFCGRLLDALDAPLALDHVCVDFQAVKSLDSSAVALLLEWHRRAQAAQRQLELMHLPSALSQLIKVYGVEEFLQIKA
ncbi:STAS domain-containing protein [Chitinibacter bivalviorum]|uniref:STAS domain-containing protein n=1 Tax=Chitinibacter bivalviorum TaxID=2739434 RepID=A0A7H9BLC3_9NEIS|nr:STAS domain-containing protein [Chitinibacter bivalviorum]QLG88811.1 STAS domain-containing protein [Chitinibacter bivalviorum]